MKKGKIIIVIAATVLAVTAVTGLAVTTGKLYTKVVAMEKKDKKMAKQMKKAGFKWDTFFLNYSAGALHDIYDDTKVVDAYNSEDDSKLDEKDKFVLDTAKGIIKDVIKDGMTDYEKEQAIYDWQFKYIHFDEGSLAAIPEGTELNYTPYGVLKSHSAICVGNATTFKLFMDLLDIDCKIIHSTTQGEHAWNMVKIDGDWYHVDLTFDGGSELPTYNCFNVPDSVKQDGSYPYNTEDFPKATSYKHWLNYQNAEIIEDYYTIPKLLSEAVKEKKPSLILRYKDPNPPAAKEDTTTGENTTDDGTVIATNTSEEPLKDNTVNSPEYVYTEVAQMIDSIASQFLTEQYYVSVNEQRVDGEIMAVVTINVYNPDISTPKNPVIDMEKAMKEAEKYFKKN
ncbi:MAG: transglutaminase domain-containing protein [Lachnospiraceae bacterium]